MLLTLTKPDRDRPTTGWKLRELMARKRLTNRALAEQLAELSGISTSPATISTWRNSDEMPLIDGARLAALVSILGCTRNELLGD